MSKNAYFPYFDESIAGHILDSVVRFVHKLEQLVDDSLEELPVGAEKSGILSDYVHDVRRDNGLQWKEEMCY